jgi:hypothetical protein
MNRAALISGLLLSAAVSTLVDAADLSHKGTKEFGFNIGIGDNFSTSLKGGNVSEDIKFLSLMFDWGKIFKELPRERSFQLAVEGAVTHAEQEGEGRWAVSATPLFIYNFKKTKHTVVFTEAGLGLLYTDLDPAQFGSQLDFLVQAGIGFRYRLGNDRYFRFSYRYQHISNGGLDEDNEGIDSNFLIFGISFLR